MELNKIKDLFLKNITILSKLNIDLTYSIFDNLFKDNLLNIIQ